MFIKFDELDMLDFLKVSQYLLGKKVKQLSFVLITAKIINALG